MCVYVHMEVWSWCQVFSLDILPFVYWGRISLILDLVILTSLVGQFAMLSGHLSPPSFCLHHLYAGITSGHYVFPAFI